MGIKLINFAIKQGLIFKLSGKIRLNLNLDGFVNLYAIDFCG
jgi:hypothetical protein